MGKPHSLSHYSSRSLGWPEPQGEKSNTRHTLIGHFPLKQILFALFIFHHSFELEAKFKLRQIIAEKHLIVLMHTFVEHSCTLVLSMLFGIIFLLCVDLFSLFCLLSFDFVRVCLEQCYIWEWMACLDGLGWHFWIVLVPWCLPKWMGMHLYMSLMP